MVISEAGDRDRSGAPSEITINTLARQLRWKFEDRFSAYGAAWTTWASLVMRTNTQAEIPQYVDSCLGPPDQYAHLYQSKTAVMEIERKQAAELVAEGDVTIATLIRSREVLEHGRDMSI